MGIYEAWWMGQWCMAVCRTAQDRNTHWAPASFFCIHSTCRKVLCTQAKCLSLMDRFSPTLLCVIDRILLNTLLHLPGYSLQQTLLYCWKLFVHLKVPWCIKMSLKVSCVIILNWAIYLQILSNLVNGCCRGSRLLEVWVALDISVAECIETGEVRMWSALLQTHTLTLCNILRCLFDLARISDHLMKAVLKQTIPVLTAASFPKSAYLLKVFNGLYCTLPFTAIFLNSTS